MDEPERLPAPQGETLQVGPARPRPLDPLGPGWRCRGALLAALVVGVVVGGGAAWWWQDRLPAEVPASAGPATGAGAEVRLVLTEVLDRPPGGGGPLKVDAVLLHGRGDGSATVTGIHRPSGSIEIRVPALPITLSVNDSFERVRLRITPLDCALATRWTPSAQPFTLTWEDDAGDLHEEIGGDHDAAMELALIRYVDSVCGARAEQ